MLRTNIWPIVLLTLPCALGQNPRALPNSLRPTVFVRNTGQAPSDIDWQAVGAGFELSFSHANFTLRLLDAANPQSQRISFVDANPRASIEPLDPQPGKISFFRGSDPTKWASGLTPYSRLRYANLYPGIDLLFYAKADSLEYDFVVAPGADPSRIRLRADDGSPIHITSEGALQVGEGSAAVLHRPVLYQSLDGGKQAVEGAFSRLADDTFGFSFGNYDRTKPLVIDPTLSLLYSTYFGGPHDEQAQAIALDAQNNAYILGYSASEDYPVSGNAYQPARKALGRVVTNMVLTKINSSGVLLYSTFFGGSTNDGGAGSIGAIALDAGGNAYVTSITRSSDFPVTANAYQATFPSGASTSAFLSEIGPDGSTLKYSSFLGGSGGTSSSGIALNPQGNLVLAGTAGVGLPTTATAYLKQITTGTAAFVAVFNPSLNGAAQLLASTYYGATSPAANNSGTGNNALAMALDSTGNPWIAGQSFTNNLPTTANALQASVPALNPNCGSGALNSAAYLAKLSADLTSLAYASYLSGKTANTACSEYAHAIVLDGVGNVYVAGSTASSAFPTTNGVFQKTDLTTGYSEFVSKVSADGTQLLWSTYLGGSGTNSFQDSLALDSQNNVWVSGTTQGGANFPIVNAYQAISGGGYDGHVTQIKNDATSVLYSTYLGGSGDDIALAIALDPQSNVYVAGYTTSRNYPVSANAFQPQFAQGGVVYDGNDVFFTILGAGVLGGISPATGGNTGDATITIGGSGFLSGAGCALTQGVTTIQANLISVAADGSSVTCTFALNGAATGSYNVVVTNPNGVPLTRTNAFTVSSGGSPQIWTNVVGRSKIRNGAPSTFVVSAGNSGASDAYFTALWVVFPSSLTYSLTQPLLDPTDPLQTDWSMANAAQDSSGNTVMKFILPHLPPNSTVSIGISLTAASDTAIQLQSYTYRPWYDSIATATTELTAAMNGGSLPLTCTPNASKSYLNDCIGPEISGVAQNILTTLQTADPSLSNPSLVLATLQQQYAGRLLAYLNQSPTQVPQAATALIRQPRPHDFVPARIYVSYNAPGTAQSAVGSQQYKKNNQTKGCTIASSVVKPCCNGFAVMNFILKCPNQPLQDIGNFTVPCDRRGNPKPPQACPLPGGPQANLRKFSSGPYVYPAFASSLRPQTAAFCPNDDSDGEGGASSSGGSCSSSGGAIDPNDKSGLFGDGSSAHYVKLAPLTYNVAFENEAAATLPASQVTVTDQLDAAKVDLTSLTLQTISFGTHVLQVPSGTSNINTTYSISSSLSVRIQGSLNSDTGLLTWTFTSLDPSTGLPPSDPTVGFLPPDTDGVKGQGSVVFTVSPKATLTTGTQIVNQASVYFDTNAPILTPSFLNTIDVTLPASTIGALSPSQTAAPFNVSWSGSDTGSGIATYDIWVSDNAAPFQPWLAHTPLTTAAYFGQPGHTYGFYSIATDKAGNTQAAKSVADATTAVSSGASTLCQINQSPANLAAVQLILSEALGTHAASNDLNGDTLLDVRDIQIEINAALGLGCGSN